MFGIESRIQIQNPAERNETNHSAAFNRVINSCWNFQASIADWTTNRWVTTFSDQAEKLLGYSSDEVGRAFDNNKDELERMVSKILFKGYIFKIRAKIENFGVNFCFVSSDADNLFSFGNSPSGYSTE